MAGTTQGIGLNTYDLTTDNGRDFVTGMSENMVDIDTAITDKVKVNDIPSNVNLISSGETVESLNGKKFASNTDIVKDRANRTQDTINRVFYKNMCKEFTSDGSAISVNNGMDGYLLQTKIEGQTVKNVVNSINKFTLTTSNRTFNANIKAGMEYTFIFNITKNTKLQTSFFAQVAVFGACNIGVGEIGKKIVKVTALVDADNVVIGVRDSSSDTELTIEDYVILTGDFTTNCPIKSHIPFGLNSTQAYISNLGVKYSFYMNSMDKASGTVLTLGGIEGYRDTFEIKEDGSANYAQNTKKVVVNGTETFGESSGNTNTERMGFHLQLQDVRSSSVMMCDKFKYGSLSSTSETEYAYVSSTGYLVITISKSKLASQDIQGFKLWLQANPVTVRYQLATPIVTTIDKSLVPTILTQLQNQFIFGEGVAPYSVTIKAPTTDDIAKSYPVTLLNSWTQTVGTATPVVNLANTGIVRLQMDLTAPTTGMNATLFTLPTELRPITNARIPVFVNGVSQLATIDKTTGNVNLASVPSASANVYIKTDYRRDI